MNIYSFLIAFGFYFTCIYITYKAYQWYEYKHCLSCPLKKENEEIEFECFAEDMRREREEYFRNEKKL